jgi:ABC-type anion transport system duplicated permease subunit
MGAVVLMMLGAQWYILFNVAAGAQSIPRGYGLVCRGVQA